MSVAYKLCEKSVKQTQGCGALDEHYLDTATFGDRALRTEIIGLFLAQLDAAQRSLNIPLDVSSWQFLTHTLKGAAAAVGAGQIQALAEVWGQLNMPRSLQQRQELQEQLASLAKIFKSAAQQL